MRSKPTQKARTLRLDAETAIALDEMMDHIEAKTRGNLWHSEADKRRILQGILRGAFEAVLNFESSEPGEAGVTFTDDAGRPMFNWPLSFDVRPETEEERDWRVLLGRMSEGEPIGEEEV